MSNHIYAVEKHRLNEIPVVCSGDYEKALKEGKAVQFYEMDYRTAKSRYLAMFDNVDIWYTERNGDPITMLVPKGTKPENLPTIAMDYIAFEWIDPDNDFGTGVRLGGSE